MDKEIRDKILELLNTLPSEDSIIDYKLKPYEHNKRYEFIKDVCGFLNCRESYGKDKFIIFGVTDTKYLKGIDNNPMEDDSKYQDLLDFIEPRPLVETGTINYKINDYKTLAFGYIHILASNTERVYCVKKNYPEIKDNKELFTVDALKNMVFGSVAYIRHGSRITILNEYERRAIYNEDKSRINISNLDFNSNVLNNTFILPKLLLVSSFDESNDNDRIIISEITDLSYETVADKIKNELLSSNNISYKNNIWKINNNDVLLKNNASKYFKDDLNKFKDIAIEVLSDIDPKYDLDSNERLYANINGFNPKYSNQLKRSICESLAILNTYCNKFINCKDEAANLSYFVLKDIFKDSKWQLWATLENYLPLLAESNPKTYLDILDKMLKDKPSAIKSLYIEYEDLLLTTNYANGFYNSLQIIAWDEIYLYRVSEIYLKLYEFDKDSIKKLSCIILPSIPQTLANFDERFSIVKKILNENRDLGWELLMYLMPDRFSTIIPSSKPKYLEIIKEDYYNKINPNYWFEIEQFVDLAITNSRNSINKLLDLTNLLTKVTKEIFDKLYNKLSSNAVLNLKDESRYLIWKKLENIKSVVFSNQNKSDLFNKISELSNIIKPNSLSTYYKRYFISDYWRLNKDKLDHNSFEKYINKKRIVYS